MEMASLFRSPVAAFALVKTIAMLACHGGIQV